MRGFLIFLRRLFGTFQRLLMVRFLFWTHIHTILFKLMNRMEAWAIHFPSKIHPVDLLQYPSKIQIILRGSKEASYPKTPYSQKDQWCPIETVGMGFCLLLGGLTFSQCFWGAPPWPAGLSPRRRVSCHGLGQRRRLLRGAAAGSGADESGSFGMRKERWMDVG